MSDAFAPIVRARPDPIFGRPVHPGSPPKSITARYFSAYPSDSTSRRTPCPPKHVDRWLQVRLACFRLSPSCLIRLLTYLPLASASEALPPLLDTAPLIRAPEGLEPS